MSKTGMDGIVIAKPRRPRRAGIRQCDIARAIKGAIQAGMDVREVIATPTSVRILSVATIGPVSGPNEWDVVFNDG